MSKQVELHQTKNVTHSKRGNQQNEEATYGVGENISKTYIRS